jgi:cellobiose phosphorylase
MKAEKTKQLLNNDGYYFPLFNERGLKASITPFFAGDLKIDHDHYALKPTTEVDLFDGYGRNVIFEVDRIPYFLNGQTPHQQKDELTYETGLLYQRVVRKNAHFTLDTTSFIPREDNVELHRITFRNNRRTSLELRVTTAVMLYARSADQLRDHRHVTSLLQRIEVLKQGILVTPTLSFNERGHEPNHTVYSIFAHSEAMAIDRYIPVLDDFIAGGSLRFPKGLEQTTQKKRIEGYEAMGALGFEKVIVEPGASLDLYVAIGIHEDPKTAFSAGMHYLNEYAFQAAKERVTEHFERERSQLSFHFQDKKTSDQLDWVVLQPLLRRVFGNSYLPHHDYGRGGRGWRDLWQDLLAIIMDHDVSVYDMLHANFAGVRIDGSNATIIGDRPGSFKADRNAIPRLWSDHGAWPLLTVEMYLHETNDQDFLLLKQTYFKDRFSHFMRKIEEDDGSRVLKNPDGTTYQGTILEHLLIQNLTGFHNTGEHGYVRLEGADWNDGLDQAKRRGETVAFTHMYAKNIMVLSALIDRLAVDQIDIYQGIESLLKPEAKIADYFRYIDRFDGYRQTYKTSDLVKTLREIGEKRIAFLRDNAFQNGCYCSYFDDYGQPLERNGSLYLTGQAIALMSNIPTKEQARSMVDICRERLFDHDLGGYRLNSEAKHDFLSIGRAFAFAYGHKENGAVFSHMAIMYAYGLYRYGFVKEGREALISILQRAQKEGSKTWVGIPEYFNDRGIGKYFYLTGSASWILKVLRDEVFGVHMVFGVVSLEPKLVKADFIAGKATMTLDLFGKTRTITYHNPKRLDYGEYQIESLKVEGVEFINGFDSLFGDIDVFLTSITT